jgi:hypothetical protein
MFQENTLFGIELERLTGLGIPEDLGHERSGIRSPSSYRIAVEPTVADLAPHKVSLMNEEPKRTIWI